MNKEYFILLRWASHQTGLNEQALFVRMKNIGIVLIQTVKNFRLKILTSDWKKNDTKGIELLVNRFLFST
jgi:hypothetical protein